MVRIPLVFWLIAAELATPLNLFSGKEAVCR